MKDSRAGRLNPAEGGITMTTKEKLALLRETERRNDERIKGMAA